MGILMAIGTYIFMGNLPGYRTRAAAQRVAAHMQYMKARAVVTNRYTWFETDTDDRFFTGFLDEDPYNTATVTTNEYLRARMDMPDTLGTKPGFFLPPTVKFGYPAGYTPGSGNGPDGTTPAAGDPVTTSDDRIGFRPTALPVINYLTPVNPSDSHVIFLTNEAEPSLGYAVAVSVSGRVKIFRYYNGVWQ
jgi:hypothetical protein